MSVRVNFPGDNQRMLVVDSCTTAGDLLSRAAEKMQLSDYDEYALMIAVQMGFNMPIMPDDYMLDVLTASERCG